MSLADYFRREQYRQAINGRYAEKSCPMCGKPILTRFYNDMAKAWFFKHQRAIKGERKLRAPIRESYYCEAKTVA